LANDDVTKLGEITRTSAVGIFNYLAYRKDKIKKENAARKMAEFKNKHR
jgi:hypothetical protein